jgi:SAM-dependent MidA family methyltransferase
VPEALDPGPVGAEVEARIRRHGPLPFDEVMELALYHPHDGFYAAGGRAGRRGDFITSPEVGPLFGAVIARALDHWWLELGRPDPFVVVEAGAGVGTLARAVRAAEPRCLVALTYLLVERSAPLRERHEDLLPLTTPQFAFGPAPDDEAEVTSIDRGTGPRFVSLGELPAISFEGIVVANELLDNLPCRLLERRRHQWYEVRVGLDGDPAQLIEVAVPATDDLVLLADRLAPAAGEGGRIPIQTAATSWLQRALGLVERGRVVVIDYASTTPDLAGRPWRQWLRTFRGHTRGSDPLRDLGTQDITCEVALDQLSRVRSLSFDQPQSAFLDEHGIGELVEEGRRTWHERAHLGDLEAVRGRSRVGEAEALLDPSGLGSFRVAQWLVPGVPPAGS